MANDDLFSASPEKPEAMDLKRTLLPYLKHWYLFVLGAVIGLGLAYVRLRYYTVPLYSVYGTLLVKDDKGGGNALNELSTFKSNRNIDNETEVLKSKSLMTRVVTELDLFVSYHVEGRLRDREIYGAASPVKVVVSQVASDAPGHAFTVRLKSADSFELQDPDGHVSLHKFGQPIARPYATFAVLATATKSAVSDVIIVRFEDIHQVADYYNRAIGVQLINKETSILFLSLTDPIPAKAKDVVNKLMEVYNRESIEDKNLMTTNMLKFLDDRLKYLTSDLSTVEQKVEKYKSSNGFTDIGTQASTYNQQANNYSTQISEQAVQINILESLENYLNKSSDRSLVPSTLGIKDETLGGLLGKFNELQLERERMLRTTQPGNPLVQNMSEQLANLRASILENLHNIKRGLQITNNNLRANSGQFQSKIRQVPGMERQLLEINRQQSIKQNIYSFLLQKREETALALAATASVSRVLDPAMGGDAPINLNGQSLYLMALLLGLGLPFAGIYTAGLLNNKVQTQQDVRAVTAAPIIGEIAHNTEGTVVVTKSNRTPIAEMFRLVRANLSFATVGKDNLVLLITSGRSGEGKTFFSINLAASLSITGKRVVLLDLDLRNPKVAKELRLPEVPGLTNYLAASDLSISDIIQTTDEIPDLLIIGAGSVPPNPAELMMSAKFIALVHELRKSFDYIIIDTPPVGQVADALTLNAIADYSIYMVRYNYTQKNQLEIIRNIHANKTLNQPMIVLNDAKEANGNNYGYGYGYGYGSDTVKDKGKKKLTH